jgi:chaperonin GroEL
MAITFKTDQEAREGMLAGIEKLGKLVTITLGPKGRNVALDRRWSSPAIVHDGVSVANEIDLKDPFENMGAQLVKEAASKTNDNAGDGTTTATLLAWKLIKKGFRLIEEGVNPMMMKDGMDIAVLSVIHLLHVQAKAIKDGDLEKVATISAANPTIGKIIADAMEKVGNDGVITVEEGMTEETVVEYKEGMSFDKGYGSPAFVTDQKNLIAEIENPMILFTDMTIDSLQDFSDFLDNVLTEKERNLVIIAERLGDLPMSVIIDNHKRGVIRAIAIPTPSFGNKRIWMLEDMATLTGGTVITRQSNRTLSSVKREELGQADKVWCNTDITKIIGGHGTKEAITERITGLKQQIEKQESDFEKKSLRERIAKLSGGAAIIKVGAQTETELKDRKERIIDAVEATKSAVAEGIIAGGGIALLECQDSLRHLQYDETDPDVLAGIKLVLDVLDEPMRKIITNAGRTPEIILERIKSHNAFSSGKIKDYGYNVVTNEYGDMFDMGVIDPVKVTRQALQNAVSVASMILTTDGLITEIPEDKKSPMDTPPLA